MSAYEMEKSLEEISKLIKEVAGWIRIFCEKETKHALENNLSMMVKRVCVVA